MHDKQCQHNSNYKQKHKTPYKLFETQAQAVTIPSFQYHAHLDGHTSYTTETSGFKPLTTDQICLILMVVLALVIVCVDSCAYNNDMHACVTSEIRDKATNVWKKPDFPNTVLLCKDKCTIFKQLHNLCKCAVPKSIHTPLMEGHWKFLGGRGLRRQTLFYQTKSVKLNWNFLGGGGEGCKTKSLPWEGGGGIWIFSGITYYVIDP